MQDDSTRGSHGDGAFDADATLVIAIASDLPLTERPPALRPRPAGEGSVPRRDTPLLPGPLPLAAESRATLTVLTGIHAGRLVSLEDAPVTIGRSAAADMMLDEVGVSRRHARVGRAPEGGFYVEDLGSVNGTFVGPARVHVAPLAQGDLIQLGPHLRMRFAVVEAADEAVSRQLYESSVRDPLTHVFNRRYLSDRLLAEIGRARRSDGELAVLMIDVDSLKTVNDCFGHIAGDRVLSTVAARILRTLRVEDVLARYGGDEFVVLAVGTTGDAAEQLAERVRRGVEGLRMSARGHDVRITTSIGVASLAEVAANGEPAALLALADARMYAAKVSGKNKVAASGTTPEAQSAHAR